MDFKVLKSIKHQFFGKFNVKLIGGMNNIDYVLLPIGDNFTMGPDEAIEAVKMLKPNVVIPIHYNTWEPISKSPEDFKKEVEKNCKTKLVIIDFNESINI
ncbi:MAG: MBL fold metallo-hydrolase [Romboutsia sp.]|nr:MBL fold metallo-hydrolase [Romboutsia sp.]